MVGTTRSRVSLFMNRFRKLGFVQVHSSLLHVVLHDWILRRDPRSNAQAADSEVFRAATVLPHRLGSPLAKGARRYPDSARADVLSGPGIQQVARWMHEGHLNAAASSGVRHRSPLSGSLN
jgi:hypothetical protein